MPDLFKTIAFRLTLWYAGIFSVSSCVAFALFYFLATQTLQEQTDRDLLEKARYFSTVIQRNGIMGASKLAVIEAQAAGEKRIFFRLLYPNGEVFASSHMSYWQDISIDQGAIRLLSQTKGHAFKTWIIKPHDQKTRVLYSFVAANVILQTGIAMDFQSKFIGAFKTVFSVAMGFIVIFSAVSGLFLARKALAGVKEITRTANAISGANLEKRVPETGNRDELDLLANTFNRMLDRIQDLIKSIREMSDNIAHDLKSPLTRIRGFAEIALVHKDDLDNYRAMAANTIEESDRLLDMINTMLVISKAEAGEGGFVFKPVNLSVLIQEACELFVPVAEDKKIQFTHEVPDQLYVEADARMLQRAFSNLLDNALKYTLEKGRVHVDLLKDSNGFADIRVTDTGPGIDPAYKEKIFERFFRAESSRSTPGTGLGLSLARTIAREHKGELFVESQLGKGSIFSMRLPYRNIPVI
ncbi:MAG: HAMP domain-containing histidine kinase [Proteobacteria bacterium]|nr:HAMP domain-containing protein [Desulfobacula sp.]MBU3951043.1 HAMP domain-containing histidine kinase [Pseudomonadota bacterium]MBU4131257.1 HAMP domain-containing histidine kinase [Pseudomonadota bacterium]